MNVYSEQQIAYFQHYLMVNAKTYIYKHTARYTDECLTVYPLSETRGVMVLDCWGGYKPPVIIECAYSQWETQLRNAPNVRIVPGFVATIDETRAE